MLRICFLTIITIFLIQSQTYAQTSVLYVGEQIPKHIELGTFFIAENSDTLIFNNKILERGKDYRFNKKFKRFDLLFIHESKSDSLIVKYRLLPSWLLQKYGNALPEVSPHTNKATIVVPLTKDRPQRSDSDILLKCSKSLRFSTSKSGSSGFNQTLDLNLSGHLAKNLTLKGTISDRGYNPSYGSSNSRLNELDKINLQIESPNFMAQVGDIVVGQKSDSKERQKKISGLNVSLHNDNMSVSMIAARPRGQFVSVSFLGVNDKQGPYQIKSEGVRLAIIPGSEMVWLDGVELTRGSNDDYTIDYPNGQITFNVAHLIDSRTRVLIDYEPLASEYKQEYLQGGTRFSSNDSTYLFSFDWIREGDDKDENLSQIFSADDEALLANLSGEELIFKSGLLTDTLGDYEIISDSLPDTVYNYVGEQAGNYDVRFSFVDSGNGDYSYLGGNRYQFVGAGAGDYLPIILLQTPKRRDYLNSSFQFHDTTFGELTTTWSQSRYTPNLFAQEKKSDNQNYYELGYENYIDNTNHKISVTYRKKEIGYIERNRINQADYIYQYYLPNQQQFSADEELIATQASIKLHRTLSIVPSWSRLRYSNQFDSKNSSLAFKFSPQEKISINGDLQSVKTDLQNDLKSKQGNSDNLNLQFSYAFYKSYKFTSSYKKTERTDDYVDTLNGFAHDEYQFTLANTNSEISYSFYNEDSLHVDWAKKKTRNRWQLQSKSKIGQLDYNLQFHYQETDEANNEFSSFFTRANFIYASRKDNLKIQSAYLLSNETRFTKGIRYLEVNDGEGDYIFSDSQFVPESGGNYILVEELLSESAPVKRGEKTFSISKRWDKADFTYNSVINEELFATESRSTSWLLPFYSNSKLSYLFFKRSSKASIKAFPMSGGYSLTLNFIENNEKRFINSLDRVKQAVNSELILNQKISSYYIEERFEYFSDQRDVYYFREGDIDGFAISGKLKQVRKSGEYSVQFKFRSAVSADDTKSQMYLLLLENRLKIIKQGELKISSEFYKSQDNNPNVAESYLLTNNHPGNQGAIWSLIFRAKVKKEFRLNFSIQGRHSDINKARIFARTEFVAEF